MRRQAGSGAGLLTLFFHPRNTGAGRPWGKQECLCPRVRCPGQRGLFPIRMTPSLNADIQKSLRSRAWMCQPGPSSGLRCGASRAVMSSCWGDKPPWSTLAQCVQVCMDIHTAHNTDRSTLLLTVD